MNVLALNCGSSTLKFRLLAAEPGAPAADARALAGGRVERLGDDARLTLEHGGRTDEVRAPVPDHAAAVDRVLAWLADLDADVEAVGHRVVHGGARFTTPTRIDADVVRAIEALESLAPLHNRPALAGIRACQAALKPAVPMVAVFDTAFHASMPESAARYAIPADLAERHGIRRYGFHGISYEWATARSAAVLGRPVEALRLVALHLGNGASAAAIRGGRSMDTSMGFTPLEGLVMGTRSGDIDPAIVGYLVRTEGVAVDQVEAWLNERSGLAGLSGGHADVRDLLEHEGDDPRARLALAVFCHRARNYLGAYLAVLEGADAVVFTGGIGEHQPEIRHRIAAGFAWCGLALDPERNAATRSTEAVISTRDASIRALVVPADEERVIASQTATCLAPQGRS